jgi:hypothetical protein
MIFAPELVKLIRARRKTQTRRRADGDACRYRQGRTYAVQPGRGKRSVARITVEDVRDEPLGAIRYPDVRREGFHTTAEFVAYWTRLFGEFDPHLRVWVISFALGDVLDHPRLLIARSGTTLGDYTDITVKAMHHEGEAVPENDQSRFARVAREREAVEARLEWRAQRQHLLELVREVRNSLPPGVKDDELRGIERQVESLNRKIKTRLPVSYDPGRSTESAPRDDG